jgi:uncharacterized protein YpuA (DUF1002 family)
MVADYYLGAKIAIDSAKTKKMKHDVQFFDSNETENTSQVEELVNSGKMVHELHLDYSKVQSFIKTYADKPLDDALMLKGKKAYEMIYSTIANYQN